MRWCVFIVVLPACGRDTSIAPDRDWPSQNGNDAPLPNPELADAGSDGGISPLATSFKGSIADLRQAPNLKNGLRVKLPYTVVISVNGGGDYMTVSDPVTVEYGGLEVQRCLGADLECKKARPAFGAVYALSGTLSVSREGALTLTNTKADLLPDAPIALSPLAVTSADVELGRVTGNEAIHSSYVGVLDAEGAWAVLEVADVEPEVEKNGNFPSELDSVCGIANLSKPGADPDVSCCPSGVGPKYGYVHLRDTTDGKLIALGTGNYRDIDFTGWPCSTRDLAKALRVGDQFLMMQGVFAIKRTTSSLSPTRMSDYVLVRR